MDGFLLVDKPKGMTSLDVCMKLKKSLKLDKCGHSGTLDPNTTGILVVAVNRATKLFKLINEHDKQYIATIVFGFDSDTLDVDGNITNDICMDFSFAELKEKVAELCLETTQIPPMTSAIKLNGKKLYEYQRKGIEVEVKPRDIKIYDYEILSDMRIVDDHIEFDIRLDVAKGFYVRSFARDLGILLGGCAILKELRRTYAGDFNVKDSKKLDCITLDDIKSIDSVFDLPKVEVNDFIANLVCNGVVLDERQTSLNEPFYVTNKDKRIAIYEPIGQMKYKPILLLKGDE